MGSVAEFNGVTLSPTSGSELPYDLSAWTSLPNMDKLNCYDYAFGNANPNQTKFSQPVVRDSRSHEYTCHEVERGILEQYPRTSIVPFDQACGAGERKITLVVDAITPSDFHFMRQDDDGFWSHKPGYQKPKREDGSGNLIAAPHESNRDFGSFNYDHVCNYYCIPADINYAT